jgi:hypothetical protein
MVPETFEMNVTHRTRVKPRQIIYISRFNFFPFPGVRLGLYYYYCRDERRLSASYGTDCEDSDVTVGSRNAFSPDSLMFINCTYRQA